MRELSLRELNRATLARQLLLEREPIRAVAAVERLCAVQAQWSTAPYVALWSRVRDFERSDLTRARHRRQVVRGTLMRLTLHLVSARDYLALAPTFRARRREYLERAGVGVSSAEAALRRALASGPRSWAELGREIDGFDLRLGTALPLVHVPPAGDWKYFGRMPLVEAEPWLGRELGDPAAGAKLLVRRYLAAFGPASRADLLRFAGLRAKDMENALDAVRLRRLRADDGRELLDLPRAPLPAADTAAPPRFLGRWDNAHLGYDRRARIVPDEYAELKIGLTGDQAFLVDGFVAGAWTVERAATSATLELRPFAPLPRVARREVEDEAERLLRWHEPEADAYRVRWS